MQRNNSYSFKVWSTMVLISAGLITFILHLLDNNSFNSIDIPGPKVFLIALGINISFSLPLLIIFFLTTYALAGTSLPAKAIKGLLSISGIPIIALSIWSFPIQDKGSLFSGQYLIIIGCYYVSLLAGIWLYKVRKNGPVLTAPKII